MNEGARGYFVGPAIHICEYERGHLHSRKVGHIRQGLGKGADEVGVEQVSAGEQTNEFKLYP
jgi:hypothetical protein